MNDAVKIKEGHHIFTTRRCWCNGIQSVMYYRSYGLLRTKIECDSCFYASDKQSTEFEIKKLEENSFTIPYDIKERW
jgi:hypothetical protein